MSEHEHVHDENCNHDDEFDIYANPIGFGALYPMDTYIGLGSLYFMDTYGSLGAIYDMDTYASTGSRYPMKLP